MKTSIIHIFLLLVIVTSCSKYKNFSGYEQQVDATEEKISLITSNEQNAIETALFDIINEYRVSIDLNEMQFESTAYYYAGIHTDYMIEKGVISHAKFDERAQKISNHTGALLVAENVASKYDSVEKAFTAWIASPGHRKNIEGDYNYSAISIKADRNGELYFTQLFIKK